MAAVFVGARSMQRQCCGGQTRVAPEGGPLFASSPLIHAVTRAICAGTGLSAVRALFLGPPHHPARPSVPPFRPALPTSSVFSPSLANARPDRSIPTAGAHHRQRRRRRPHRAHPAFFPPPALSDRSSPVARRPSPVARRPSPVARRPSPPVADATARNPSPSTRRGRRRRSPSSCSSSPCPSPAPWRSRAPPRRSRRPPCAT